MRNFGWLLLIIGVSILIYLFSKGALFDGPLTAEDISLRLGVAVILFWGLKLTSSQNLSSNIKSGESASEKKSSTIFNDTSELKPEEVSENSCSKDLASDMPKQKIDLIEDSFFSKALEEFENQNVCKATLGRAISESDGDPARERSTYIKLRVKSLRNEYRLEAKPQRKNEARQEENDRALSRVEIEKARLEQLKNEGIVVRDITFFSVDEGVAAVKKIEQEVEDMSSQILSGRNVMIEIERGMSYDEIQEDIDKKKTMIREIKNAFSPIVLKD